MMLNKNKIHPTISDRPLGEWGAEMLSYEVGPCDYRNGYAKVPGKIYPVKLKPTLGLRPIAFTLDFSANSPAESAQNISDLTDLLQNSPEIMLPDGFLYWCEFDSCSTPVRKAPWIEQVAFKLYGVRHGPMETATLTAPGIVDVRGNIETPMIAVLTPTGDEMTFQGITISCDEAVTIDGIHTTVKDSHGNNIFGSTDMTKWPSLVPGENEISMTGVSEAVISFYPLWK